MERENIIAATKERLEQFNLGDLNRYKESTQEQFITIEQYFLQTEERINKALEEIKSINFNIRGICNTINISKSTVYNNPNTLRLYIEERINDIENQDLLSKTNKVNSKYEYQNLRSFLIEPL